VEEKVSLPIKTKIAAWGLMISGGIISGYGLWGIINSSGYEWGILFALFGLGIFLFGLLNFILGFFLLRGRLRSLKMLMILIPIICLILISWAFDFWMRHFWPGFFCSLFSLAGNIFSLILLLLDRKNFWKVTS
jgi:hypothetical protein